MRRFHWLIIRGVNVGGSFSYKEVRDWFLQSPSANSEKRIESRPYRD